ncbi:MAG: ATP-binding protein [Balneola sp.]|jgi:two-component system sensor histidine kinase/response regulator
MGFRIFIFILFFTGTINSIAEPFTVSNIDSLDTQLKSQNGLELANTLIEILEYYQNINVDSSVFYATKLIQLSDSLNYSDGILAGNASLVNADFIKGAYYSGIERGLPLVNQNYEKEGYHLANLFLVVGNCYGSLGLYRSGIEYYLRAREIFAPLNSFEKLNTIANNLGALYIRLGNFESALEVFSNMNIASGSKALRVTTKVNFGFIYFGLNDLEKAENYFLDVFDFGDDAIEVRAKAISSFKLGDLYTQKKDYEQALTYFNRSLDYFSILENEAQTMNPLNGIAEVYFKTGKLDQAKEIALRSERIGEKTQTLSELNSVVSLLADIYKEQGDYKKAFEYSIKNRALNDSLNINQRNQEIQVLEAEYNFERKEEELRREQSVKLKNQRIVLSGVTSFFLISLVFIFVFYSSKKKEEKANLRLENLNKDLEETNKIKNQLFSIIAHDLRNPLSSLYGLVTLLEMKVADKKELERLIPELVSQFKHTSTLLNNLLNWSKSQMQGYKIVPTKFDVNELVRTNIELLSHRFKEKEISVVIKDENPLSVFADKNMVDLVMLNLLSNALKYCDKKDEVEVYSESKPGFITFSVKDTGTGIPENKIGLLFTSSFYSTNGTRNEAGTGLGLMLCKEFIEKNGGKIWVESEFGQGTTFHFTLPVNDYELDS